VKEGTISFIVILLNQMYSELYFAFEKLKKNSRARIIDEEHKKPIQGMLRKWG
jgi:hypothetical protein